MVDCLLGADDPDVHRELLLSGTSTRSSFSGECSLLWDAEEDYTGDEMPTECTGSGEFTATAVK